MKTRLLSTAAFLAAAFVAPAAAATAPAKPEISYFLARTNVGVQVALTLASCPTEPGELPEIAIEWTVAPQAAADPTKQVHVDVSTGFLAKRSNAFAFNPNGTLAAFNGSSEGQGGAVISSVLKIAGTIAPLLSSAGIMQNAGVRAGELSVSQQRGYYCSKGTAALLAALKDRKNTIRALEDKILSGDANAADLDLLDRRRKQRVAITELLTIKRAAEFAGPQGESGSWNGNVKDPEMLKDWFTDQRSEAATGAIPFDYSEIKGRQGFAVTVNPVDNALASELAVGSRTLDSKVRRALVYRRPVQAKVVVDDRSCAAGKCIEELDLDGPLLIGQWGALSELPVGDAGLFGSREAVAKFDAFGTPLEISYGSDSGAANIASTIDAAGSAVTALADADTVALERAIKKEELRQKLRDLRAGDE